MMTQAEKDQMIQVWIPTGSILTGSPGNSAGMGGSNALLWTVYKNFKVGIQLYSQITRFSSPTRYDMYQRNTHEKFKNEPWMKELLRRRDY
jgi:hypothetical protein